MTSPEDVIGVFVTYSVDDATHLAIRVADDGVSRMGTGDLRVRDGRMYIGMTEDSLLVPLRARIPEHWFDHLGVYEASDRKGKRCELRITMMHEGGAESHMVFLYGTESMAPSKEIMDFVEAAVETTEAWYQHAVRRSREQAQDG